MATAVGEAVIKLSFDGKELTASLDKVEPEVKKKAGLMQNALGGIKSGAVAVGKTIGATFVAGTAAATAGVVALGKSAFNAYADFEQLTGGVETLFGEENKDKMLNFATEAYRTAGLSANEYMEQATSFSSSLIQSLGNDTKKATDYANRAIIDMSDNANKMGTDISLIQNAYQGFAKQNYTMLDNLKLGYGGTKTEMERLIKDASKMTAEQKKLGVSVDANSTSFGNIVNAISVMQEHLGIAGTTSKEASETISGSITTMKSAWQNLMVVIAESEDAGDILDWDEVFGGFIDSFKNVIQNIGKLLPRIMEGIGLLVDALAGEFIEIIPPFIEQILPPLIDAIIQLAIAIIPYIPQILKILIDALIKNLPAIIEGIKKLIPQLIGLTPVFVGAALQIFGAVAGALFGEIGNWLGSIGQFIGEKFSGIWKGICDGAKGAWQGIKATFGNVAQFFGSVFSAAWNAVKAVFSTGGRIFDGIKEGIVNAFKVIVNGIIRGINKVVAIPFNAINGALRRIKGISIANIKPFDWISTINVPQIPLLAQGGYANGATGAVIGEAGKEVVLPLERNTDNWAGLLASTLSKQMEEEGNSGRSIVVNMTNQINNEMDAEDIGRKLMESIRRAA